jgi:NTP pyrophosphatase (non-canonical NTP hydrolase)
MHKASTACTVVGVVGADEARDLCERAVEAGTLSWAQILTEEVAETFEAVYEGDARKTRAELIQVAAVAVAWIEQLDEQLAECEGGSK